MSFSNHLGSTSAVIDWQTGKLTEWRTHHAYGSDESHWKADRDEYDNTEEPYGFTGKEEDEAVGLHYFGARYYSSYVGRWLSPDPPVVHGGVSNHYNYGANSPYIYVDPDGNVVNLIAGAIGAAVGAVAGFVTGMVTTGNWRVAIAQAAIGAAAGFIMGATAGAGASVAGLLIGAGVGAAAGFSGAYATARIQGSQ